MSARTGARGPARGRVQKQRNNSSALTLEAARAADSKRRGELVGEREAAQLRVLVEPNRWQRMDWLRVNSARHGQRLCGMSAVCDEVTVQRGKRGVSFGGLMTCNSRICPSCGPKIAATTRTEIETALTNWQTGPSRRLWFGTFTVRHDRGQSFRELADAVSKCWAAATGGRGWMRDREQHGIAHTLRIFEQKWGQKNGWHIHVHALFFIDDSTLDNTDHSGLLTTMFKRWAAKALQLGLNVPLIRAQDLRELDAISVIDRVAGYFAKETTDATNEHPGSIGAEMSNAAGKQGLTSLTPGQILAWAMAGEDYVEQLWGPATKRQKGRGIQGQEYAKYLYSEFEQGMKGRRTIAWSAGMREALGLGAELTDEQLQERAEAVDQATADTLVSMSGAAWQKLNRRPGRRAELYAVAGTLDGPQLVEWLAGYGVDAVPHRRDRDEDSPAVQFTFEGELPY